MVGVFVELIVVVIVVVNQKSTDVVFVMVMGVHVNNLIVFQT